jgi:hypothetical protein
MWNAQRDRTVEEGVMRGLGLVVLVGMVGWLVAGCGMSQDKQGADKVAVAYLKAIQSQDVDKAMSFWDTRFMQEGSTKLTEAEWRKVLTSLPKKLGKMKSYKSAGWRINKQATPQLTGTVCTLSYNVTYEKFPSQETIVLVRPTHAKTFKVAGHNINSKGLLLN